MLTGEYDKYKTNGDTQKIHPMNEGGSAAAANASAMDGPQMDSFEREAAEADRKDHIHKAKALS